MPTSNSRLVFAPFENLVKDLLVERIIQVWVGDITNIKLRGGEGVYLAIVMDTYTRIIRGWALGRILAAALSLGALQKALDEGKPKIHHSDQGVQMLLGEGVVISMAVAEHA